jgi:hypothetical protein
VRNEGSLPVTNPPIELTEGKGSNPSNFVAAPDLGTLGPGEARTYNITIRLPPFSMGSYSVTGVLGPVGQSTAFVARTTVIPWGLVGLAVVLATLILLWIRNRIRSLLRWRHRTHLAPAFERDAWGGSEAQRFEQPLDTRPAYYGGGSAISDGNDVFGDPSAPENRRAVLGADVTGMNSATGADDSPDGVVEGAPSDQHPTGSGHRIVTVTRGAFVVGIESGGPAQSVGIRAGDVILSFGEKTVDSPTALSEAIREQPPGSGVVVSWIDVIGQYRRATVHLPTGKAGG